MGLAFRVRYAFKLTNPHDSAENADSNLLKSQLISRWFCTGLPIWADGEAAL